MEGIKLHLWMSWNFSVNVVAMATDSPVPTWGHLSHLRPQALPTVQQHISWVIWFTSGCSQPLASDANRKHCACSGGDSNTWCASVKTVTREQYCLLYSLPSKLCSRIVIAFTYAQLVPWKQLLAVRFNVSNKYLLFMFELSPLLSLIVWYELY